MLPKLIEAPFCHRNFLCLLLQAWQVFAADGQQHVQQTRLVNGRIGNADVVPHELRNDELGFQQVGQGMRVNLCATENSQAGGADGAVVVWTNHAHSAAFRPNG